LRDRLTAGWFARRLAGTGQDDDRPFELFSLRFPLPSLGGFLALVATLHATRLQVLDCSSPVLFRRHVQERFCAPSVPEWAARQHPPAPRLPDALQGRARSAGSRSCLFLTMQSGDGFLSDDRCVALAGLGYFDNQCSDSSLDARRSPSDKVSSRAAASYALIIAAIRSGPNPEFSSRR
jgi:hypothetical protein